MYAARMISYVQTTKGLGPEQLTGFFDGWPNPPTPDTHLNLLIHSDAIVLAMEDDRVVGFITAVCDKVLFAYIPLLEVLPTHRGRGIGGELVRRMLDHLSDYYAVDLACDAALVPFYERLGLKPASAMLRRNYAAQSGRPMEIPW